MTNSCFLVDLSWNSALGTQKSWRAEWEWHANGVTKRSPMDVRLVLVQHSKRKMKKSISHSCHSVHDAPIAADKSPKSIHWDHAKCLKCEKITWSKRRCHETPTNEITKFSDRMKKAKAQTGRNMNGSSTALSGYLWGHPTQKRQCWLLMIHHGWHKVLGD